jgi:glycogen(starch) synthase
MKVLMLGWELPPNNSGGLGVACLQLCKALSNKKVTVKFVLPYVAEHDIDFMEIVPATEKSAAEVLLGAYDSDDFGRGADGGPNVFGVQREYEAAMGAIVNSHEFDLIHAHDWLTFRAGMRARELSGKPLVVHVHSVESDRAGGITGNPLVHEIESLGLMSADHIVAVSELTKQKIIDEYHIPAAKITVAHNSVDQESFPAVDPTNAYAYLEQLKEHGYKVVVNIGRLTIQKGLLNLLSAAAKVVENDPKTIFLIVGSGELEHELIRCSAELGIGRNVLFAGFQRGKQWRDAFTVADLFVMPSVSEPFGLTPLEAIGYGTPSIISKQSGVAEIYKNCLKIDYWDVDKLANDIAAVLRYDTLRSNMTDNALLEFLSFTWQDTADKLLAIYHMHAKELEAIT